MKTSESCVDVLVIGGGPAGAAAAIELARNGADMLLVERRSFPRLKVCGGCLGPRAMACLRHLDLDPAAFDGAMRLDRVRMVMGSARAVLPLADSVAVDRAELDHRLLERARAEGAEVWMQARARIGEEVDDGRRVYVTVRDSTVTVIARIVVLATGLAPAPATAPDARVGLGQSRRIDPRSPEGQRPSEGEVWMVSGSRGYIGMVRFADGRLNVAASMLASAFDHGSPGEQVDKILVDAGLPALGWHDGWTGTPPLRAQLCDEVENRILPVGDAAGFWEPFTGEGIGWGLEAGIAVAPAALDLGRCWDPRRVAAWTRERRAWMRKVQARSRTVAAISAHPRLARAALGLIRQVPAAGRWLVPAASAVGAVQNASGAARGAA